ncbi:hypothetical protein GCM10022255_111610 [Dactylosporangium darangshiense]|uniref:Uncharacterized protein n=1 Tax=Dactylosporangium darangshiense TaxID=579108 RepID=A0ABP8DUV0_9ACTN
MLRCDRLAVLGVGREQPAERVQGVWVAGLGGEPVHCGCPSHLAAGLERLGEPECGAVGVGVERRIRLCHVSVS